MCGYFKFLAHIVSRIIPTYIVLYLGVFLTASNVNNNNFTYQLWHQKEGFIFLQREIRNIKNLN